MREMVITHSCELRIEGCFFRWMQNNLCETSEANLRKYNKYTHSMIKVVAYKSEEASVLSGTRRGQ